MISGFVFTSDRQWNITLFVLWICPAGADFVITNPSETVNDFEKIRDWSVGRVQKICGFAGI